MEQVEADAFVPASVAPGPDNPSAWRFLSAMARDPLSAIPASAYRERVTSMTIMGKRVGVICDPEIIHEMLVRRVDDFPKSEIDTRVFSPVLGAGLLTAQGADWRWKRRLAAPYFAPAHLDRCVPDMVRPFESLAERWSRSAEGGCVEVSAQMTQATFDVISATLFTDQQEIDFKVLSGAIDDYLTPISWVIGLASLKLPPWLPHPGRRQLRRAGRAMRASVGDLIAVRRRCGVRAKDICGDLMAARDPETDRVLSDEDLVDMLLTLIAAGHETSANALTWALYCLALSVDLQEELAAEVKSVAGRCGIEGRDIDGLVKIEAFLKEVMRLFPPAPLMARQTRSREVLGGIEFDRGAMLFIPLYALHRNERLWDHPQQFRIARFLRGNGHSTSEGNGISRTAYMPFGAGPRVCLGAAFAMREMKVGIAALVRRVRFAVSDETVVDPVQRVTLRPRNGLKLKIMPV